MAGRIGADTSLLIDFFKGERSAVEFVRENAKYLSVSELVVYEFLCGNLRGKEKAIFLAGIESFPKVGFERETALAASNLFRTQRRAGKPIGHQDALIAGSYLAVGIAEIATRNAKHFKDVKELKVLIY